MAAFEVSVGTDFVLRQSTPPPLELGETSHLDAAHPMPELGESAHSIVAQQMPELSPPAKPEEPKELVFDEDPFTLVKDPQNQKGMPNLPENDGTQGPSG